jgi:hypothetical protein
VSEGERTSSAGGEEVDLDPEQQKHILGLHERMRSVDHYALLGVERDADKKTIKRAYYDLAARLHPDRFYGRKLGSFKTKMEAAFGAVTQAHDVLTDKEQRAEYDAYLSERDRSQGIEAMLKDVLEEITIAEDAAKREVALELTPADLEQLSKPPTPPAAPTSSPRLPSAAPSRPSSPDLQARRAALAQRLLGGPRRASGPQPAAPVADQSSSGGFPRMTAEAAMDALKRRYDERVSHAKQAQARKYAATAAEALAANDPVAAANAYRVALTLLPDDPTLRAAHEEAQAAADSVLSESYERQAQYQEKSGHWQDAGHSWTRVAHARPNDPHAHERAANAIVRAQGSLHEAAALGKRAVELAPEDPKNKITLANVYIAAGLTLNARRELEAAAQISPHDDTIKTLMKRIAKA